MFVRVKTRSNGKKSIQIVESYRRVDKISQKILRHVGQAETDREVEELKKLANSIIVELKNNRKPVLPLFSPEEIYGLANSPIGTKDHECVKVSDLREEQRIIVGIGDVFGKLYSDLQFDSLLGGTKKDKQWNSILKACVIARVANPSSKRQTASFLERDYGINVPLEKIYRMMNHVHKNEEAIKEKVSNATLSLLDEKVDVLFFDVTTLYFESIEQDELKDFGFSKDCKFKEVQIVLSLVTTKEGLPITYDLFPGNMYEGHTLINAIESLQKRFSVDNIVLVADRAMFNEDNLKLMEEKSINYIVAAKLKSTTKSTKNEILKDDGFKAKEVLGEIHWVKEIGYKSRRLVVSYSSKRARKDQADRQRLVDRLMKKVKGGKINIQDVIPNQGTKKYLKVSGGSAYINEDKIAEDSRWDGLHGVITNLETTTTAREVLAKYRGLWQIEEAFRINKHDLKMRPIYHWTPDRIRGHICICFLAYALIKQAVYRVQLQYKSISLKQIRDELLHAQASLLVDIQTHKKYLVPSKITVNQKKIYKVFGLHRSEVPFEYKHKTPNI